MPADPAPASTPGAPATVFDLTNWTVLRLSGRDAVKFLHNFCTADVKKLAAGEGCEAFLTNVKARVVGHAAVFADAAELPGGGAGGTVLTLLATPGQGEKLAAHLDRYLITEDVTIRDATGETAILALAGSGSPGVVATALIVEVPGSTAGVGRFVSHAFRAADAGGYVRRADLFGTPTCLVETAAAHRDVVKARLAAAGVVSGDEQAFERLRLESGFPLYGTDVSEDQLAPEAGRPWAISYTKGCYLGQEPIARIDALGHVNRLLCRLRLDGAAVPERGAAVLAEGKEVGTVRSAASGYSTPGPVALAYVRTKFSAPGTRVAVRVGDGEVGATIDGSSPA